MLFQHAIQLYRKHKLSLGKAAELAGYTRLEFIRKLQAENEPIFDYDEALIEGVRLILRLKFRKILLYEIRPEIFPAIAQYNRTEGQYSLAAINGPAHSGFLHSSTDQILAGSTTPLPMGSFF